MAREWPRKLENPRMHMNRKPISNLDSETVTSKKAAQIRSMDVLIRTDGVELTDELRKKVCTKISRVRQYAPGALRARVLLQKVRPAEFRAHVLYEVKGNDVSAEHRANDPLKAINSLAQKIEQRLRKRKTAHLASRVRSTRARARVARRP